MHAISYSKEKAKQRNDKERQLQQEYKEATKLFENDPDHLNSSRLNEVKEKLELFYEEKTKGIIIRTRTCLRTLPQLRQRVIRKRINV